MKDLWVIYLIDIFFTVSQAFNFSLNYHAELEFDNVKSNNELLAEYTAQSLCQCSVHAKCQKEYCCFFGYNRILKTCRVHKKVFRSEKSKELGWRYYSHDFVFPTDCKDLFDNGQSYSGVYEIYPYCTASHPVRVYCDMETMNGGWTAIQKRVLGSVSFNRNWEEYKNGFGAPEHDFWIGNEVIHQLTKGNNSYLYVSITHQDGRRLYELYERFSVLSETEKYRLFLAGNATGTLGDQMLNTSDSISDLSGMYFSTLDRDNDGWIEGDCSADHGGGGWWFNECYLAFLNGPWLSEEWRAPWFPKVVSGASVRETIMMIKRH